MKALTQYLKFSMVQPSDFRLLVSILGMIHLRGFRPNQRAFA